MKMPKAWPMLASALNPQLGWGAQWKGVVADLAGILVLHLLLETGLGRVGRVDGLLKNVVSMPSAFAEALCQKIHAEQ